MSEKLDRVGSQRPASDGRADGWWLLADTFGEFMPDTVWWLAIVVLVIWLVAALISKMVGSSGGTVEVLAR